MLLPWPRCKKLNVVAELGIALPHYTPPRLDSVVMASPANDTAANATTSGGLHVARAAREIHSLPICQPSLSPEGEDGADTTRTPVDFGELADTLAAVMLSWHARWAGDPAWQVCPLFAGHPPLSPRLPRRPPEPSRTLPFCTAVAFDSILPRTGLEATGNLRIWPS